MNLSAVLLAGGESRRMGQDKATLLFHGDALHQIQLDRLRALKPVELFVSARRAPSWLPTDAQFVADEPPSRGPLSGIAATLNRIRTTHLVVLAIDMPFMTMPYLRSLLERALPHCGVLPTVGKRTEPLAAIYPVEAGADFSAALSSDEFSLQPVTRKLIDSGKILALPVPNENEGLFHSLNSAADLDIA